MLALYAVTLLISAGLLFAVEPLVAKSLLPIAGGTASVWTTAAAFFQVALLAGYLYAHALRRWLSPRAQVLVHFGAVVVVFLALPLRGPAPGVAPARMDAVWLFGQLSALVGAPFLVLAATAPLVQHWLSVSRHASSRDPYFLYAASNAGSLLGLLAYPFVVEPLIGLASQRRTWTALFAVQIGLLGACAISAWRARRPRRAEPPQSSVDDRTSQSPTWRERWRWMALAAVPSSLLLSVTNYISTDLAAIPLMWVAPLAIYLVTFILAFGKSNELSRERVLWIQPFLLIPVIVGFTGSLAGAAVPLLVLHALAFFVTAFACHQTLARARPAPRFLTEYYVWISAGGAAGGMFNVIVAPSIFSNFFEYPLGIALAVLLVCRSSGRPVRRDIVVAFVVGASILGAALAIRSLRADAVLGRAVLASVAGLVGLFVFAMRERPLKYALSMGALACGAFSAEAVTSGARMSRSFFGVHAVVDRNDGLRQLVHGNTVHGAQSLTPEHRREPLTYYHRTGPIGQFLVAWRGRPELRRVGVVGLGTGSLAAYSEPGEHWTFFEIDQDILRMSQERGLFTFLADARGHVDVKLGDARQTLQDVSDGSFGVLILDAFTSDSIPAHLLTREAMDLYLRKLQPSGVIAVHVSNRYLDVASVVAATAHSCAALAILQRDEPTRAEVAQGKTPSHWVLVARSRSAFSALERRERWSIPANSERVWTDDATSVWSIMRLFGSRGHSRANG